MKTNSNISMVNDEIQLSYDFTNENIVWKEMTSTITYKLVYSKNDDL